MLLHHLRFAWRNIVKDRRFSSSRVRISTVSMRKYTTFCSVLVITLLTVSFQSVKAALTNPVKSLRSE